MAIQSQVVRTLTWLRDPTRRVKVLFISVVGTVIGVVLASTSGGFLPYAFIGLGVLVLIILATSYIPGDTPLTHAEPVNTTVPPQPPYPPSTAAPQPYPPGAASNQRYPPSTVLPFHPSSQNAWPAVDGSHIPSSSSASIYPPPSHGYASQQAVQFPNEPDVPPPSYEEAMRP